MPSKNNTNSISLKGDSINDRIAETVEIVEMVRFQLVMFIATLTLYVTGFVKTDPNGTGTEIQFTALY